MLSIGGGQSLGREGPSVQIGSNLASTVAGFLGVPKQGRRAASAAGAAAGLSAAFNAPLAAIAFVLEEIIGDLNSSLDRRHSSGGRDWRVGGSCMHRIATGFRVKENR